MSNVLIALFRHNQWANEQLLEACRPLSDAQLASSAPGTYGRVDATLQHLCAGEELYVWLLSGRPHPRPLRETDPFPGIAELVARSRASGTALVALAEAAEPGQISRDERSDPPELLPVELPLVQAINHATEHRAHVMTILSQQGVELPEFDGWAYAAAVLAAS
jgi:uncharacterized damage-inducible protein DinB